MTCREFQGFLPDTNEGVRTIEQEEHLRSCPACKDLVLDLDAISREARLLQSSEEPSPIVWNSIEIRLREEGLIRGGPRRAASAAAAGRWQRMWLLPATAAAVILIAFGFEELAHRSPVTAKLDTPQAQVAPGATVVAKEGPSVEDQQLLRTVAMRSPAMRASYEANLENVNSYIRDAEASTRSNPNDEEAQQSLMNAYEQRAMVYEMALDRSLP